MNNLHINKGKISSLYEDCFTFIHITQPKILPKKKNKKPKGKKNSKKNVKHKHNNSVKANKRDKLLVWMLCNLKVPFMYIRIYSKYLIIIRRKKEKVNLSSILFPFTSNGHPICHLRNFQ